MSEIDNYHEKPVVFRYRGRHLTNDDIVFINDLIKRDFGRGRTYISKQLCLAWQWLQPNGKLKEYAARDLLLRLEENGFLQLPERKRSKDGLRTAKRYDQIPLISTKPMGGTIGDYPPPVIQALKASECYLWDYLIHHYHYLGLPTLVGEHLKQIVTIDGQVVACLGWASAAWKIRDRDEYIGWDPSTRERNLRFLVNNARFLIPDWVNIRYLASKVLSMSLAVLDGHWQARYGHGLMLAETFVDISRYAGTCYRAANWIHIGQTSGSAKKGNVYSYHGQPKAIYVYPLKRNFRRLLCDTG